MTENLYQRFVQLRDGNDSLIIVGLDPNDTNEQRKKVLEISQIQDGIIGFKPNAAFYQYEGGRELLGQISKNIGPNLIRMLDFKSPDGANTNAAGFDGYEGQFDTITIAPAAGCIEETIDEAKSRNYSVISMGAMSFPGVLREINSGLTLFKERVDRAIESGTSGFVMGATSFVPEKDFSKIIDKYRNLKGKAAITPKQMSDKDLELALVNRNDLFTYIVHKMNENPQLLALVPGFGRQGGNLEHFLTSNIDLNRCMINAGSDILKAENPQQAIFEMRDRFNQYR